jgi:hypothetical protein
MGSEVKAVPEATADKPAATAGTGAIPWLGAKPGPAPGPEALEETAEPSPVSRGLEVTAATAGMWKTQALAG